MGTKQETIKLKLVLAQPDQKPLFAPQFVNMVKDAAYETLRNYMQKAGASTTAIALLDDIVLTCGWEAMRDKETKVSWIDNQSMTEALGAMSYNIIELGGATFLIEK